MTELETQLLKIIEEQQQKQFNEQQMSLETSLKDVVNSLDLVSKRVLSNQRVLEEIQASLATVQKGLMTTQTNLQKLETDTARYTTQINGKVQEMSQITANIEDTERGIISSRSSTTELSQNIADIETSLRAIAQQKLERQREVEQPRPKKDRGMDFKL